MATAMPEQQVLHPLKGTDSNEWPCIPLNHAEVYNSKTGELANLLLAAVGKSVRVIGKLGAIDKDKQDILIKPDAKIQPAIEVASVTRSAYGEFENKTIGIWGLGRAGWYELKPSRLYKPMYDTMVESVAVFYFLRDTYDWEAKQKSAEWLFKAYSDEHGVERQAARACFYKHREFLVKAMTTEDRENAARKDQYLRWADTPFYEHLKGKFPELFARLTPKPRSRTGPRSVSISLNAERKLSRSLDGASQAGGGDHGDNVSIASSKRGKRKSDVAMPPPADVDIRSRAISKFLQDIHDSSAVKAKDMSVHNVAKILHERFDFDDEETARSYLLAYAPQLVAILASDAMRNARWTDVAMYAELARSKMTPAARKRMLQMKPRLRSARRARVVAQSGRADSGSAAGNASEVEEIGTRRAKSSLRPKGGKFADKGAGKRGKRVLVDLDGQMDDVMDVDEGDSSVVEVEQASSILRSRLKRKSNAMDIGSAPRKGRREASLMRDKAEIMDVDVAMDMGVDTDMGRHLAMDVASRSDGSDSESESEDALATELPLRERPAQLNAAAAMRYGRKAPVSMSALTSNHTRNRRSGLKPRDADAGSVLPLVTTKLPSTAPNGPGQSWECESEACMHKVYGVDKELGQRLVREHLAEHAQRKKAGVADEIDNGHDDDDEEEDGPHSEALRLVKREEEMCRLPVGNLIKRIRELAEAQKATSNAFGLPSPPVFPMPIVRSGF